MPAAGDPHAGAAKAGWGAVRFGEYVRGFVHLEGFDLLKGSCGRTC